MKGLFVGLATLDFIYLVEQFPSQNQKIVALDQCISAGGPAANAAIAFQALGDQATWIGVLGNHPISQFIKADLGQYNISIIDLEPNLSFAPPVSSVTVTQESGDRSVISVNATKIQGKTDQIPDDILDDIDIILIDGHQMAMSLVLAQKAQEKKIPVVMDGGSWKEGFETVLPYVDYCICSGNFYPPNCHHLEAVLQYLSQFSLKGIGITQGENPIIYAYGEERGEIEVNLVDIVDTLGAGDIFHGAFCHYLLKDDFVLSLQKAAQIASFSCQFLGTRAWINQLN